MNPIKDARVSRKLAAATTRSVALLGLGLGLFVFAGEQPAWAHQDPPGCSGSGVDFKFEAFRADGSVLDGFHPSECETITYQIKIAKSNIGTPCAFEGGTMTIKTPDGVSHNVTPGGGVPCTGGTGACTAGVTASTIVSYTVSPADVFAVFFISATGSYTAAFSHTGTTDTLNTPTVSIDLVNHVDFCLADTACRDNFCDPLLFDSATGALGNCTFTNAANSTPCPDIDGNQCTFAGCNGSGTCDQNHVVTVCPPDGNPCTDDLGCNPASGLCLYPPTQNSTPCPDTDGNNCTTAGCEQGTCVQSHLVTPCPPDNNECTSDPGCNPQTGQCLHPPVPDSTPCTDTDGLQCTTAGCEAGSCVQKHMDQCTLPPDHYSCYEIRRQTFSAAVNLVDQFGTMNVTLGKAERICAPTDKNDEDPVAPTHPAHLEGYVFKGPFTPVLNQRVVNQFGEITVDLRRTSDLLVPTAKSLTGPPPLLTPPAPDHFTCYKVRISRHTPKFIPVFGVKLDDQFGTVTGVTIVKPLLLCAPTDKNGENPGAETHEEHLMCYKTKQPPFGQLTAFLNNQFGQQTKTLIQRRELCVPSLKNPPPTTTTTSSSTSTSTTSSTSTTIIQTLCCDVPPGAVGNPVPVCLDAVSPDVDIKCQLLGGTLVPGVCDPNREQCVPPGPVPPSDFCCECPVPAPPFPHPQLCFEGVIGHEAKCQPPCVLFPAVTCGPISERCGGSPSGAFLDPTDSAF